MKKVVLTKIGGPDALVIQDAEIPEPRAHEILIKVDKAGVAFDDVMMRHGRYPKAPSLPYTPGYDVCGFVTQKGGEVTDFEIGDKVVALTQFGGYAEYATAHSGNAVKIPMEMDSSEAVALGLNYISAYDMLTRYNTPKPGSSLLVYSAAGGVGTAVLQIAKSMGLKIYGAASAGKLALLKQLGAIPLDRDEKLLSERVHELEPEGVDMVLDPVGGEHWRKALGLIKKGGSLIGYGFLSMFDHDKPVSNLYELGKSLLSIKVFNYGRKFHHYNIMPWNHKAIRESMEAVVRMYTEGKIKPVIGKVYSLMDARKAHEDLATGKATGKLVLDCNLR